MEGGNVSDIASNTLKDVGVKDTRAARKMAMKKDGIVDVSNMLGGFIQRLTGKCYDYWIENNKRI